MLRLTDILFLAAMMQIRILIDMKHSQKAKNIILTCMLAVGIFSAIALLRGLRPSKGLPYESVTMEQALEYMEFEEGYVLLDIGTWEEFARKHIAGAVNIPYDSLMQRAPGELPDKTRMIYVYGREQELEDRACRKLSEMGYTSITCIGLMDEWTGEFEGTDV